MTEPARRKRKSAEVRRQDIIDAAMEILRTHGTAHLTTRSLSRAVGIAQPTLFLHFGSKTQVLIGVIDEVQRQLEQGLRDLALERLEPAARLEAIIRFHLRFIQGQPAIPKVLFSEELQSDPEVGERMNALVGSFLAFLSDQIAAGQKSGALRPDLDPQQSACLLIASVQGLAYRWILSDFRFVLEEQADLVAATFLDGWRNR